MSYDTFKTLNIKVEDRVAWLTINHPPVNLFDRHLIGEMAAAGTMLAGDESVGVVVLQSADPEIFIAHADVNLILAGSDTPVADGEMSFFQIMVDRFRTMDKVTIGKIDGIARGGGLELLAALDMRFCSLEKTRLAQPELGVGIIPGGGGTARWPRLIGPGRALELVLGCDDFDGAMAERYGLVNRALPSVELGPFVDTLARRIGGFSPQAVALIKEVAYREDSLESALIAEAAAFAETARSETALTAMKAFIARDGQSRESELGKPIG